MKNNKRLALGIGLVGVIIYLWLNRRRKKKAVVEAKNGANLENLATENMPKTNIASANIPKSEVSPKIISSSPAEECGGSANKPTSNNGKVEQTISIMASNANFSGSNSNSVKAQYFR